MGLNFVSLEAAASNRYYTKGNSPAVALLQRTNPFKNLRLGGLHGRRAQIVTISAIFMIAGGVHGVRSICSASNRITPMYYTSLDF